MHRAGLQVKKKKTSVLDILIDAAASLISQILIFLSTATFDLLCTWRKLDMLSWLKGQKGRKTREQVSATLEEKHRKNSMEEKKRREGKQEKQNNKSDVAAS